MTNSLTRTEKHFICVCVCVLSQNAELKDFNFYYKAIKNNHIHKKDVPIYEGELICPVVLKYPSRESLIG